MKLTKLLAVLMVLALMLCLIPTMAMADPADAEAPAEAKEEAAPAETDAEAPAETEEAAEEPAEGEEPSEEAPAETAAEEPGEETEEEPIPVVNGAEETFYAGSADTVYNNGGTVYNNGGTVYNNGGTVYNNDGLVYNNGGVTYSNGGTVYNNGGTVYSNDALVYTFTDDVVESHIYGYHRVSLAADYSAFAEIEGLGEEGELGRDGVCTITPKAGYRLLTAEAEGGTLTANEDGSCTLSEVEADLTLTLTFQAEAPEFDLAAGTYSQEQTLTITGPEGAAIYYTTDGTEPREDNSLLYEGPITLTEGVAVTALALAEGAEPSEPTAAEYAFVTVTAPELAEAEPGYAQPEPVSFTVENRGSVTARIRSVELSGEDAACFGLNTKNGAEIQAGQSSFAWSVRPEANLEKGTYTATVVFTLDSGETVELEIRFTVK